MSYPTKFKNTCYSTFNFFYYRNFSTPSGFQSSCFFLTWLVSVDSCEVCVYVYGGEGGVCKEGNFHGKDLDKSAHFHDFSPVRWWTLRVRWTIQAPLLTQWARLRVENSDTFWFCQEFLYNLPRITYIIIKFCCAPTFSYVKLKDDHTSLPKETILWLW